MQRRFLSICLIVAGIIGLAICNTAYAVHYPALFGYNESRQTTSEIISQFRHALSNQKVAGTDEVDCDHPGCRLYAWKEFLAGLRGKSPAEQLAAVNSYANHKRYRTDKDNYGTGDHWATPGEFLSRGGDCEDYAIFKFLSLRYLGFSADSMRIVVLVDTRLKAPHAVLAVDMNDDVLVLDNQTNEIVSHKKIPQYVPVYSVNETGWWIHTPR
jgi:predicted transglutaminase-like cysteine proteinase